MNEIIKVDLFCTISLLGLNINVNKIKTISELKYTDISFCHSKLYCCHNFVITMNSNEMIVVFVKPPNVDDNYTFKNVINLANKDFWTFLEYQKSLSEFKSYHKEFSDNIMLKKFLIR